MKNILKIMSVSAALLLASSSQHMRKQDSQTGLDDCVSAYMKAPERNYSALQGCVTARANAAFAGFRAGD